MFIFTEKLDNIISYISETCEIDKKTGHYIIYNGNGIIGYPVNKYEIQSIPADVEPKKYCYTENDGFYKNPNYKEPEPPIEDQIKEIEEALCELAELIVGGNE